MEHSGGTNKTLYDNAGTGKYSQANFSHANDGFRSADNLLNVESRKLKTCNEEGEESEEEATNQNEHQRLQTSVSASYLGGGSPMYVGCASSSYTSTPLTDSTHSSGAEKYGDDQMSHSKVCDWKNNSPIASPIENGENRTSLRHNLTPSPNLSLRSKHHVSGDSSDERTDKLDRNKFSSSREGSFERSVSFQESILDQDKAHDILRISDSNRSLDSSRNVDTTVSHSQTSSGKDKDRDRKESRDAKSGEKDKKSKKAWYNVLNPTYKSRSEELKKLFKDLPSDERLIVDYSCALQKDILVHGRLYVTSNYFSFYSKIFGWETFLSIKCKDIVALTKEKTALVIPNALQVNTETDKHFFTSFAARDKTYLMLFRIWQNALMGQHMSATELWQWVHSSYGEELGLTSDDDDYVAPSTEDDMKACAAPPDPSGDEIHSKISLRNSIESIEDVSQGESNAEDGQQNSLSTNCHDDDPLLDAPRTPSKVHVKPSSIQSPGASSHFPPIPSPGENDSHEIPTDLSDTVESDPEREKLLGSVAETVVCPSIATHHVGREVASVVYGLPIDTLFTLLFTNSKFMFDLYTDRKTYDVVISPWQSNPETNQKIRQVTYTLTLPTNSFGPKVSHVTETQVISAFSKPSEIYTVDAEASNNGIPYADSFFISNHWCLTRESATETRLTLWSQVKYKKSVWGFMKNVIDKNAFSGMDNLMSDMNASLLLEVDRMNLKRTKRRRRRAGSKGNDVGDPLHVPSPVIMSNDIHKATQIPSRKITLPSVSIQASNNVGSSVKSATIFFLCALLIVNAFLYYRLYDLEERVVNNVSLKNFGLDSSAFKFSGSPNDENLAEEWVQILRHQESLHAEELERWRKAVMEAAVYLRKAEESLRNLHSSIPSKQASKMQSLLHQLQVLQQMQEQKKSHSQTNLPQTSTVGGNPNPPPSESPLGSKEL